MAGATPRSGRSGGRATRRMARKSRVHGSQAPNSLTGVVRPGLAGGRYAPLGPAEAKAIIDAAFHVLERTGLADAPQSAIERVEAAGGRLSAAGRLLFPRGLVEDSIESAAKRITLAGVDPAFDLEIGGDGVHLGVGGAAVQILDSRSGAFRPSRLRDLYDLGRIVDACDHIHYFLRPVVARDLSDDRELDLNTAYACLAASRRPIGCSFGTRESVAEAVAMFDLALGGDGAFRARPLCFGVVAHVVPPLRFATDACLTMEKMVELGMPLQLCSAGQAGATSPAALAGALVQGLAECLAGLAYVNLLQPGFPCILAFMPFISDLRTGAMSGGSGECAVASAAAVQLLRILGLPSTACAGMTDAKMLDSQAGYEKACSVTLAAQAGANMVNLSSGMLGSIMAASAEAFVVDNDMNGAILRALRGIEVSPERLSLEVIEAVAAGDGHYLGQPQTLALMEADYLYPEIAERSSIADWLDDGAPSLWDRAHARVEEILSGPGPDHITPGRDAAIRARHPIKVGRSG